MKYVSYILKKCYSKYWSIRNSDLKKFFSMSILMFLILLNQNLIRGIKDSLVVSLIGSEVLSFIKIFIEMPSGILFIVIYTILCNKMNTGNIFRSILLFFFLFFILFRFFLFPYQTILHPDPSIIDSYVKLYPNFKWFFMMWGKWTLVLFYMIGELWPMIVFTQLYWQLANKITKTEEASRLYFFCNLVGQANLLISGKIMVYFSKINNFLLPILDKNKTEISPKALALIGIVIFLCFFILLLHRYIEKYITYNKVVKVKKKIKLKLGLYKSFKLIYKSKYLILVCILMISYSMIIHLIEGIWFYQISLLYKHNSTNFIIYQGKILYWTGICTLICSFFGNAIIQKISWLGAALVTPIVTLIVGSFFFILIVTVYFNFLSETIMGVSTLNIIVSIGGIQNILTKGTKYCFFDITKEMIYIPLDSEMSTKGKVAVDVLGSKIGKSIGSILQVISYTVFSSANPNQLAPFLMIIFFIICIIWILTVGILSNKYTSICSRTL